MPPWLEHEVEGRRSIIKPAYPADVTMITCKSYPSVQSYKAHFMSGLLHERDERVSLQLQQYSAVAQRVQAMLSGPDFHDAYDNRALAVSGDNRQFFVNVDSSPAREEGGTSWYNEGGIVAVRALAERLTSECDVDAADIGVISMYRDDDDDVFRVKKELRGAGLGSVNVIQAQDTIKAWMVNAFQGHDRKIMIVHFVAAFDWNRPPHSSFGFVKDDFRLNVATTRAREFQFLVDNLSHWQRWKKDVYKPFSISNRFTKAVQMMEYVEQNGQVIDWAGVTNP